MTDEIKFSGLVIQMSHFRLRNYCAEGVRYNCEKYGIDYVDFLNNGIEGLKLLSITDNDAMARDIVELAYEQK